MAALGGPCQNHEGGEMFAHVTKCPVTERNQKQTGDVNLATEK